MVFLLAGASGGELRPLGRGAPVMESKRECNSVNLKIEELIGEIL